MAAPTASGHHTKPQRGLRSLSSFESSSRQRHRALTFGSVEFVAVLAEKHRLWALGAVVHSDDCAGLDFGDAATGIDQLRASSGVSDDQVAFARFRSSSDTLKALAVIDQNLSLDRV